MKNVFGFIDEVKIYTSALTAEQVKVDMNQGKAAVWGATSTDSAGVGTWDAANEYCPPRSSGTCTAPVAHWKFDEKTGTTANDISGNDNSGSFVSSHRWCQRRIHHPNHQLDRSAALSGPTLASAKLGLAWILMGVMIM